MTWPTAFIGDLVTIRGGGTPSRSNESYFRGDIPWITPKDMKSWEIIDSQIRITQEAVSKSSTKVAPKNTVLVVVRSGILKHKVPIAINRRPVAINQDIKSLECSRDIQPEFLARFLKFSEPTILSWVRATTADNFPIDKIKKLRIPLPSNEDQCRIAEILDQTDALRRNTRHALAKLDGLIPIFLSDTFGDPTTNRRELPILLLGDLISDGPANGLYKPAEAYGKGTKILRIDSFYDGHIENIDALKRLEINRDEIAIYSLRKDDIVINRVNSLEYLGKSAIVPELSEPVVFESNMMRIHLDEQRISPVYAINFLQTEFIKRQIGRKAKNAVNQSSINQTDVRSLLILCPPIAEQHAFAARVAEIDKLKALHRAHLAKLDELFASLQHRAFRGEL